jgi:threonine/homoserine/homoserine lactone efflux protein
MSEIKKAYEQGLVAQIQNKPILTTLLVGGVGYLLYTKFKKVIDEAKAASRASSADTTGSDTSKCISFQLCCV